MVDEPGYLGERKRMILESAQTVFAASGYANAGAEDVARDAGVAPSAIYRHFSSKRELYLAALRDSGARLLSMWKDSAGVTGDPLQMIWQIGMDYYDHVQTRSTHSRLFFQALGAGIDHPVSGIEIPGQERHKPPSGFDKPPFAVIDDDQNVLAGRDVILGRVFNIPFHDPEDLRDDLRGAM